VKFSSSLHKLVCIRHRQINGGGHRISHEHVVKDAPIFAHVSQLKKNKKKIALRKKDQKGEDEKTNSAIALEGLPVLVGHCGGRGSLKVF